MVGILLFAFLVLAACISVVTLDLWYFEITCTSEKLIIRNQHPLIRRTQVLQVEIPLRMLCHFVIVDRRFMSILKIGMQDKEGRLMPFRFYMIAFQQGEKVQSMTASLYIYISDIQSQN
ncbi:MAG: hypothetical protein E2590_03710 [Chryseobacterium sp.]|nr:hypothetical protein [Chryseobacterium sp.]